MNATQAIDLISYIDKGKVKPHDLFRLEQIEGRANAGVSPDPEESKFLNQTYRHTQGGDKQDQPFKAYKRPKSWGV